MGISRLSVAARSLLDVYGVLLQSYGNGLELADRAVQPSAARVLEVAEEVGAWVRGRAGVVGDLDDCRSAPPHRSGVSRAGGGVCADVCPPGLEVELCGYGTPHDRTRREIGMKRKVQQPVAATTRNIRAVRYDDHLRTVATTKESLVVQLEGNRMPIGFGQGDNTP